MERGCKTSTLNHHLSVIRAFLKYASIREPVYNDCYLSAGQVVRRKEETKYIVKHFNDDALRAMLFQPNPAIKNEHRDQFYMILLYDTGARNSELLNLRLQDVVIDTSTPYIIIRGKGKKIRSVPIMMETVRHFESYIKRFHKTTDPDSLLFYTIIHRQIQRMSDDNVARFIQKYATKAKAVCPTVPEKVTPHMFRHSRALSLYRKGVPLPLIAEWLGHSNLETTLIYAYPFEVGEILASQQIDENLTAVIYTNKEEKSNLQNAIVRKRGIFYDVIETNGSVHIEKPKQLESGQLRTQALISWYDKSDKYVIMAVAYDEDVSTITYLNQELIQLNVNGYRLFWGYGIGEYDEMHMFDKNGNCLEQIKE